MKLSVDYRLMMRLSYFSIEMQLGWCYGGDILLSHYKFSQDAGNGDHATKTSLI